MVEKGTTPGALENLGEGLELGKGEAEYNAKTPAERDIFRHVDQRVDKGDDGKAEEETLSRITPLNETFLFGGTWKRGKPLWGYFLGEKGGKKIVREVIRNKLPSPRVERCESGEEAKWNSSCS